MSRKSKRSSAWEDLDITRDEVERLGEALKKEEFRKLLLDYAEEISDPENMKLYEKEVTELERERGVNCTFVYPEPCYVIKSSVDGEKKAFINICKSDKVGKPTSVPTVNSGTRGLNWSLPFTQAPPREDFDKNRNLCKVFDVVFHPDTHRLAENNTQFKKMLDNTALDAVEDNYNVQLDRKNLKFPKMKYKGCPRPTVIRKKIENFTAPSKDEFSYPDSFYPYGLPTEDNDKVKKVENTQKKKEEKEVDNTPYTTPLYVIKHRRPIDIQDFTNDKNGKMNATVPKALVVEIELPLLKSSADMVLDVTQKFVSIKSEKPAKYKLDLVLPYPVDEENGTAKFDQRLRQLVITLPVRHHNINLTDFGREDSGVESDIGRRTPESSSDDDDDGKVLNQNLIVEVERDEITLPEVSSDEAYRTINTMENTFLDQNIHYMLPAFTCNVVDSVVAFTLHVKNVEPDSVEHIFLGDFCGVHLRFTSIGAGFFPIHYAFCLKFTSGVSILEESFSAEAWDNNVIVQMQLKSCDVNLVEYYAGVDDSSLTKYDLPELAAISRKLEQLEIEALNSLKEPDLKVEVTKWSEDELIVEICPEKNSEQIDDDDDDDDDDDGDDEENGNDSVVADSSSQDSTDTNVNIGLDFVQTGIQKSVQKFRTMSESSGDELSFSPTKKGILKNRVCRSLSESSVDDFMWSSSLDMVTQSGSDSCIPEEALEEERETKKTVRFNEVVSQKTYRTNSSILGQRKKNQRKTRNKKRCQERRASESENSEGETDKERERDKKADIEVENEEAEIELDKNGGTGDEIQKISTVQESQEPDGNENEELQFCNGTDPQINVGISSKHSPNKGKRKNRKAAMNSQVIGSGEPQVEFGSDLIFDLDM